MSNSSVKINNWVLGLTGGIGCGKTAVSKMLEQLSICVVDADIIARQVVKPGSIGLNAIAEHFGAEILLADGSLNRSALRTRIFSNSEHKKWLNALLHPLIRQQLLHDLNSAQSPYVVLVAPLLFENKLDIYCDRILLIDVPVDVQLTRTINRDNISTEQANSIIAAQMSRTDKQQHADDMLNNDRDLALVKQDLIMLHKRYLKLAAKMR